MPTTTDAPVRGQSGRGERGAGRVAGTTPYPWPWNGVLDATGTAVLQVESPGALALDSEPARNAEVVVETLRRAGARVIRVLTQPARRSDEAAAAPSSDADAVVSHGIDGFYGSALEPLLRSAQVERLVLVGGWLETSVHSTMRTANDMGFECLLVVDACIPGDESLVANSVSMIEMSGGIFGAVGLTARVVEAYANEEGESS